ADHVPPHPRDDVSPVVEMPVRDDECVDARPAAVHRSQASEHPRAAVEQEPPRPLDEVARLCSASVRPGRRAADHRQLQSHPATTNAPPPLRAGRWRSRSAGGSRSYTAPPVERKIRVVIAKPGLDGHDRGAKIIARALRDAGMEVIYTGLHQTPEQIVETAIQEDADAVGISILSGAHMTLMPRILDGLRENGAEDVLVVLGGTIPNEDAEELSRQGVAAVFTRGASTSEIVEFLGGKVPP